MMSRKVPKSPGQVPSGRFAGDSKYHKYLLFTVFESILGPIAQFERLWSLSGAHCGNSPGLVWSGGTSEVLIVLLNCTHMMLQYVYHLQANLLHPFYRA